MDNKVKFSLEAGDLGRRLDALEALLSEYGNGYIAYCPRHGDPSPSLDNVIENGLPGIETLPRVAEALNLATRTVKKHALHSARWKGELLRLVGSRKHFKLKDEHYFFPLAPSRPTL